MSVSSFREVLYEPFPSACNSSEDYLNFFFHRPHVRELHEDRFKSELVHVPLEHLKEVHLWNIRWRGDGASGVHWNMLKPAYFRVNEADLFGVTKDFVNLTNVDLWSRSIDTTYEAKEKSAEEIQQELSAFKAALAPVTKVRGQESDFVEAVSNSLSRHDVVIAHAPPGYGKSALAPLIAKTVELITSSTRASGPPGDVTRGDITRQPREMTKVLHVVPTETNASSIVNFLLSKLGGLSNLRIRAVTTDSRMSERDRAEGVDYVITTYTTAEKLLRFGRFKMVVLDEAHLPLPEITSTILRTLEAITRPPSTSFIRYDETEGPRRVDKLLILNGIRVDTSLDYFDTLFRFREEDGVIPPLSVDKVQRPIDGDDWDKRRFTVRCNHLMGVDTIANLDLQVLDIMFAKRVNKTEHQIRTEDSVFMFSNYCNKIPEFLLDRVQHAAEAAMLYEIKQAEDYRDLETEKKAMYGARYRRADPFQYSVILIFVPSSACGKLVYQRVKYSNTNKMHPVKGSPLFIEPFSIHIANETMSVETCLTTQQEVDPDVKDPRANDRNRIPSSVNFKQGRIIICVNGVELGLTIPKVSIIIESGVERISDGYSRTGVDRYFFTFTDQNLFEQRLGRAGRVKPALHLTVLGVEITNWIASNRAALSAWRATDALNQTQFVRLIEDPMIRAGPAFKTRNHMESVVEGRVNATISDKFDTRKAANILYLHRCTLHDVNAYPFLDPFDARLLRSFVSCNLVAHGAMCVALRAHRKTCLRKPIGGDTSRVGPTTEINSLDLFKSGMLSIPHTHPRDGSARALIGWTSDTVPMVEMHLQLIVASGWDIRNPVPTKAELLGSAAPHESNFWHGGWTPCGPVREFPLLRQRLDPSLAGITPPLKNDFAFLYGYLVTDEERRELWAIYRQIILSLREDNMLHYPIDELLKTGQFNRDVYNMETSPILSDRGRRTMEILLTVFCTRFADPSPGTPSYDNKGAGKKRGVFKDWYRDDPQPGSEVVNARYVVRKVRAESGWKVDEKTRPLFRYSPSSVPVDSSERVPDDCFISAMDPVTDTQTFLFGNAAGKWRIVKSRKEGSSAYTFALEIECNGCNALIGLKYMIANEEDAHTLGRFREWLHRYLGEYTEDCTDDDFAKCISQLHIIWEMHQPDMTRHQKANPRNADLNPNFRLLW